MDNPAKYWTSERTKTLIELVREGRLHYDKSHEDFKDSKKKVDRFRQFAVAIGLPDTPQAGEFCSKRWQSMRESFGSALREPKLTPSGAEKKSLRKDTWEFYRDCLFLQPHIKGRKTRCNLETKSEKSEDEDSGLSVTNPGNEDGDDENSNDQQVKEGHANTDKDKSEQSAASSSSCDELVAGSFKSPSPGVGAPRKRAKYALNEQHQKISQEMGILDKQIVEVLSGKDNTGPNDIIGQDVTAVLESVEDELDRQQYRLEFRALIMKIEGEELRRKRAKASKDL